MTPPSWPTSPTTETRRRPSAALSNLSALLSIRALVVAIPAFTCSGQARNYNAGQQATANEELCDEVDVAVKSVNIETNKPDNAALARIALTNGATSTPVLDAKLRDAAVKLAQSCRNISHGQSGGGFASAGRNQHCDQAGTSIERVVW